LRLSELISGNGDAPATLIGGLGDGIADDVEIAGLSADSREVGPGYLFAALPGSRRDGRDFVDEALKRGAVAILSAPDLAAHGWSRPARLVSDRDPRRRLARMAARFYGRQPRTVVAVTGTNGKTSVADFARQIFASAGHRAASIGTLGLIRPGHPTEPSLTTPDPVTLHRQLARLAEEGVDHLAMEASSHGLDQARLDGVSVAAAAFTNLTRDHLDYHETMERYLAAKLRLFDRILAPGGAAVVNADAPEAGRIIEIARARGHRLLRYGAAGVELRLRSRTPEPDGQRLEIGFEGRTVDVRLPLVGAFQAMNALAAAGLALGVGYAADQVVAALGRLVGVPGRLQMVARAASGAPVFVDYAHTPDALETVLTALRPHAAGRLVVVFGAGGDRDPGKRPQMGAVCARLADVAIVTDDNPRSEPPELIRRAVMAGAPDAREIGDRAEAIGAAIQGLGAGDLLVVAGKGHEQGQIVGGEVRPFDDATVARAAARALGGG
jgi:UDP-N-acetylmuramoyl-L-alanyl-D-glutamate--2,6-diaminopimelate ligase